jgi:hypothetical protein
MFRNSQQENKKIYEKQNNIENNQKSQQKL